MGQSAIARRASSLHIRPKLIEFQSSSQRLGNRWWIQIERPRQATVLGLWGGRILHEVPLAVVGLRIRPRCAVANHVGEWFASEWLLIFWGNYFLFELGIQNVFCHPLKLVLVRRSFWGDCATKRSIFRCRNFWNITMLQIVWETIPQRKKLS